MAGKKSQVTNYKDSPLSKQNSSGLSTELKSRCSQPFFSGGSGGESISLPFSASRCHLQSLVCVPSPFLYLHSQPWQTKSLISAHLTTFLPLASIFKVRDDIGSNWMIQMNLPVIRSANEQPYFYLQPKLPFSLSGNIFTGSRD